MKYKVTGTKTTVPPGCILDLDSKQAGSRKHLLKPLKKKGLYEVISQVEFKAGEVIGFEKEVKDKLLLTTFRVLEEPKAEE